MSHVTLQPLYVTFQEYVSGQAGKVHSFGSPTDGFNEASHSSSSTLNPSRFLKQATWSKVVPGSRELNVDTNSFGNNTTAKYNHQTIQVLNTANTKQKISTNNCYTVELAKF